MNKNNINQFSQNQPADFILEHLNATCEFGEQFEKIKKYNVEKQLLMSITLKEGLVAEQSKTKDLIMRLYETLPIICERQIKQAEKKFQNFIIPIAFLLQFQCDEITKNQICVPFKIHNQDKLILNPQFCDFLTYLERFIYEKWQQNEIKQIDANEYYVILLLWRLRENLNELYQNLAQFEIILFPKQYNFAVIKIQQGTQTIYFHSESHRLQFLKQNSKFHQKSTAISDALLNEKLKELEVNLFDVYLEDIIRNKGKKIDKNERKNKEQKQKFDKELIRKRKQYYKIVDKKCFQVCARNFVNGQSILCLKGEIKNDLNHSLKFEIDKNPKCECGREFDIHFCDTLVIDIDFRDFIDQLILELLYDQNLDYRIYLIPLYLRIEMDQYKNQFIVVYFKDKQNNMVQIKKLLFKARNYNYDINLIGEKQVNQDDLFGGLDVYDYPDNEFQIINTQEKEDDQKQQDDQQQIFDKQEKKNEQKQKDDEFQIIDTQEKKNEQKQQDDELKIIDVQEKENEQKQQNEVLSFEKQYIFTPSQYKY
ncbi:unnamed protein product [Paramecium sonneborni]|uniref:Uncharacterized protein n=1 Tax=Paramecium sonneborni TaxID=65129 RepID=A0A8S1NIT3_9CILI|nr:unnamed protein product [Paramecium sonneborni]